MNSGDCAQAESGDVPCAHTRQFAQVHNSGIRADDTREADGVESAVREPIHLTRVVRRLKIMDMRSESPDDLMVEMCSCQLEENPSNNDIDTSQVNNFSIAVCETSQLLRIRTAAQKRKTSPARRNHNLGIKSFMSRDGSYTVLDRFAR